MTHRVYVANIELRALNKLKESLRASEVAKMFHKIGVSMGAPVQTRSTRVSDRTGRIDTQTRTTEKG